MCRLLFLVLLILLPLAARACPFCTAEQSTLTEEMAISDAAVLARLVRPAPPLEDQPIAPLDPDAGMSGFVVTHVLFGEDKLGETATFDALYFGEADTESLYLVRASGEPLVWATPLRLSETAVEYVKQLRKLPESGPERIAFFLDYLEHDDLMLSQDAYDEFARAPYSDIKGIKDRMDREQLLAWIEDPKVSPSRRRLFLTMLGVCGTDQDIPRIERLLLSDSRTLIPAAECLATTSLAFGGPLTMLLTPDAVRMDERRKKLGLDAMIACYLNLRGEEGMDLIDERFLSTKEVMGSLPDYSHIYYAVMALRFLGEESEIVPMRRVLASMRKLLDNPDFADQVIPDLARWEDWSILDRLTEMYRSAGIKGSGVQKFVREPIITYLDVATEQDGPVAEQAVAALEQVESIDPEAVRRARSLRAFGFLGRASKDPPKIQANPLEPAGLSTLEEEPEVLIDNVASEEFPDPVTFGQTTAEPPVVVAAEPDATPAEEPTPPVSGAAPVVQEATPPGPPSVALLIGAPTLAGAFCFGLFWVVLRSGGV